MGSSGWPSARWVNQKVPRVVQQYTHIAAQFWQAKSGQLAQPKYQQYQQYSTRYWPYSGLKDTYLVKMSSFLRCHFGFVSRFLSVF